ncbi:HNH endonuclease [Nonomuraea turcica]|uniref:HNH endonuclease n=1 Tax=Nonomuraea sp. G32 TaxID=3067274 RepID=UPI00273AC0B4|nr:HNH endonuclease [Nonomuraea sp. G32]MDP4508322.1 HNH endonuclease [Nonomuraea sp. G32]
MLTAPPAGAPLNIDHIHPRSRGGTDRISNLTLACVPCNEAKSNRLPVCPRTWPLGAGPSGTEPAAACPRRTLSMPWRWASSMPSPKPCPRCWSLRVQAAAPIPAPAPTSMAFPASACPGRKGSSPTPPGNGRRPHWEEARNPHRSCCRPCHRQFQHHHRPGHRPRHQPPTRPTVATGGRIRLRL